MRVRVKVCGIRRAQDAAAAAAAGADALGFIFWPPSRRYVAPEKVPSIVAGVSPLLTAVAVVVDPAPDELDRILAESGAQIVQFHGDEPRTLCEECGRPYIKSVRVREARDVKRALDEHPGSRALLLDTYQQGLPGGTGESFDWRLVPQVDGKPLILAGGLRVENVADAIALIRPHGVDVSGGVEVEPGIKDHGKIQAFIREVNRATACE